MHVVELLSFLLRAVYVEIVEPGLPKSWELFVAVPEQRLELGRRQVALSHSQVARDALLQDLHDHGRRSDGGFADQKMNVLRHHDVASERKTIPLTNLAQGLHKHVSCASRTEQRQSPVAAES